MRSFWLLLGFLLMFSFPVGEITLLPVGGFALILFSVLRMEKMEPTFKKVRYVLFAAIPVSAILLALQIYKSVKGEGAGAWYEGVYFAVRLLCELSEFATMFFMYIGIKVIGRNADIPSLEKQSGRNMTLMTVYLVSELAISLLYYFSPELFKGFEIVLVYPFALGYIWRAMNIWMAFTLLTKVCVSKS